MATRRDVEAAVAGQDPTSHLIVCNGDGKTLADRPGSGHSATLIVLDLSEKIEAGFHFANRPELPDSIRKALKERDKKQLAKNRRAAKPKQTASIPPARTRSLVGARTSRPVNPEPPVEPEPPAEPMPGQTSMRLGVV